MSPDPAIVAAYRRALAKIGVPVTLTRETGFAPNVASQSAEMIQALVRAYTPDTTEPSQAGYSTTRVGAITEGDRMVTVMAADLAAKGFPLPLQKNDKITLFDANGTVTDVLNVIAVDAGRLAAAGAIELKAAGVA